MWCLGCGVFWFVCLFLRNGSASEILDRFNRHFCENFCFFQRIPIDTNGDTDPRKINKRGNFLKPFRLTISISYWCSCWLLSKQLQLCQEPAKSAISLWAISWQCMTQTRCIYSEIRFRTSWYTKTCIYTYLKYLIMVVRMFGFIHLFWMRQYTQCCNTGFVNFLIIQSARGSLMLITIRRPNTRH